MRNLLAVSFILFSQPVWALDGFLRFNFVHHYLELHGENDRGSGSDLRIFNFGSGTTPSGIDLSVGGGTRNEHYLYGRIRYVAEQNIITATPLQAERVNPSTGTELTKFKDFVAVSVNYDRAARINNFEFLFGGHLGYATVKIDSPSLRTSGFSKDVSGLLLGYQAGLNWYFNESLSFNFMIDRPYFSATDKVGAQALFGTGDANTTLVLVGNYNTRLGIQYVF